MALRERGLNYCVFLFASTNSIGSVCASIRDDVNIFSPFVISGELHKKREKTKQKNKNERKQNIRMWFAQIARTQTIFCSLFSPIRWWSRNARNFVFFRFIFDDTVFSSHSIRVRLAVTLFEACVRIWNFRRNIGRPLRRRVSPNADNCQSIETWHNSNVRFFFFGFFLEWAKMISKSNHRPDTHTHARRERENANTKVLIYSLTIVT